MLTFTIDATVYGDLDSRSPRKADADLLVLMHRDGLIRLESTSRIEWDIPDPPRSNLRASLGISRKPAAFRLDGSPMDDEGHVLLSGNDAALTDKLMNLIFPNSKPAHAKHASNTRDVDHLIGHKMSGNDYFVTDDGAILRKRAEISKLGIQVVSVSEAVSIARQGASTNPANGNVKSDAVD